MSVKENIAIFIAGPLTSLFFAEIFVFLFLFEPSMRTLWAVNAFFWHLSTLITLTPIIRTDGYFIVQAIFKFPNLLNHGISYLWKTFQRAFRIISHEEYAEYLAQYSVSERRLLKIYSMILPVGVILLTSFFFFLAIHSYVMEIFLLTPQVITGSAQYLKTYVLWLFYVEGIIFAAIGVLGTGLNALKHHFSSNKL